MEKSETPLVERLQEAWSRMPRWEPLDLEDKVRVATERYYRETNSSVTFLVYNANTDKIVLCRESICLGSIYWMFTDPDGGFLFNGRRRARPDYDYCTARGVTLFSYEELLGGLETGTFRAYVLFPENSYQKGMDWLISELPEKYHKYISHGPGRPTLVEMHPDLSPLEFGVVYQFPRQATQQPLTLSILLEKVRGRTMQRLLATSLLWHGGESANMHTYELEYVLHGVGSILKFCDEEHRVGSAFGAFFAGVAPPTKAWSLSSDAIWPGATHTGAWLCDDVISRIWSGVPVLRSLQALPNSQPIECIPKSVVDSLSLRLPKEKKEALREVQRRCEESAAAEA